MRERRVLLGLSQRQLADAIGVTFQQVQKYENGTNRIDVARLAALASALEVPTQWFFLPTLPDAPVQFPVLRSELTVADDLASRETLTLIRGFNRIADPVARAGVIELVQAIGACGSADPMAADLDGGRGAC